MVAAPRMEKILQDDTLTPVGGISQVNTTVLEMEDDIDDHHEHSHHHHHHNHNHHDHSHNHDEKKKKTTSSLPSLTLKLEQNHHEAHSSHVHGHSHGHSHGKDMDHDHHHDQHHEHKQSNSATKKLQQACLCSLFFMCVQFAGGYYADSLAIMTDAAHLLSDVASFLVSLFAIYVGTLPANAKMPFGYHRAEVIGALISVLIIWGLTLALLYTAIQRIIQDAQPDAEPTVNGKVMFCVASFGLFVNMLLMKILGHGHSHGGGLGHGHSHGGSTGDHHRPDKRVLADDAQQSPHILDNDSFIKTPMSAVALIDVDPCTEADHDGTTKSHHHSSAFENINVRAAYIHALGDFIQSLGVCIAGALIWYNPRWQIADPITTILFSFLVLGTTYGILTRSILILMEAAPASMDIALIEKKLRQVDSVYDCHDLHIWALTEGNFAASVHILPQGEPNQALRDTQVFFYELGVRTQTIQVEDPTEREWDEDKFCGWKTFAEGENMMSVPRAKTRKAAMDVLE